MKFLFGFIRFINSCKIDNTLIECSLAFKEFKNMFNIVSIKISFFSANITIVLNIESFSIVISGYVSK